MGIFVLEKEFQEERGIIARCGCSHPEHYVEFSWWEDSDELKKEMWIYVGMKKVSFWKRIKYAIKYIFGTTGFGSYEEVMLDSHDVQVLLDYLSDATQSWTPEKKEDE